jgi:hypothetical protein
MGPAAGVRLRAFYIDYFASPGLGYEDAVCANRVSRDSNPVAPTDARAKTPDIQTRFGKVLRTGRPLARNRRFVDLWSGAVWSELVSVKKFPAYREINRQFFTDSRLVALESAKRHSNISSLRPNSLRIRTGNCLRSNRELNRAIREISVPVRELPISSGFGRFRARKNAISRSDLPGVAPVRSRPAPRSAPEVADVKFGPPVTSLFARRPAALVGRPIACGCAFLNRRLARVRASQSRKFEAVIADPAKRR